MRASVSSKPNPAENRAAAATAMGHAYSFTPRWQRVTIAHQRTRTRRLADSNGKPVRGFADGDRYAGGRRDRKTQGSRQYTALIAVASLSIAALIHHFLYLRVVHCLLLLLLSAHREEFPQVAVRLVSCTAIACEEP
jgi:hypothetical protein